MGKPQKIVITCLGSRGDVQPYIALGMAIKAAGYEVHMLTNDNHSQLVNEFGLNFVGCFIDAEDALKNDPLLVKSQADGDVMTFLNAMAEITKKAGERHFKDFFDAIEDIKPDLIVKGTLSEYFAVFSMLALKIPVVWTSLNIIPSNNHRMIFGFPSLPCGLNNVMVRKLLIERILTDQAASLDPFAQKKYGMKLQGELLNLRWWWDVIANQPFGYLVGVSPTVGKVLDPAPGKNFIYCGQFAMDEKEQVQKASDFGLKKQASGIFGSPKAMEDIKAFIEKGSKPIFMGWGSMTAKSPKYMVKLVAEAAKLAGARAIVFEGWAHMSMDALRSATEDAELLKYCEENVLFVGKTPHAWLFPQCSCVIHHGGAGTLSTCLKAGVPQIITPVFLDQWDHAYFLNKSGIGYGFEKKQLTNLTAVDIAEAVKKVNGNVAMEKAAMVAKEEVEMNTGAQRVVEFIENFWTKSVETGEWSKYVEKSIKDNKESNARCCG